MMTATITILRMRSSPELKWEIGEMYFACDRCAQGGFSMPAKDKTRARYFL